MIVRNEFLTLIRERCCYSLSHLLTWVCTSKYQCIYALPSCILLQLVPTSIWTRIVYSNCCIYAFLSLIRVLNAVSMQLGFGYQSLRQIEFQLSTLSAYPWFLVFMCLSLIVLKFLWYKRNCLGLCLVDIGVDLTFTFAKVIQAFILVLLCFSNCWSVLLFRLVVITFVDFDNFYFRNFWVFLPRWIGIESFGFYSRLRMWILVNWFGFRI